MTAVYAFLPELSSAGHSDYTKFFSFRFLCRQLYAQLGEWQAAHLKINILGSWENYGSESLEKVIDFSYSLRGSFPPEELIFLVAEFVALSLLVTLAEVKILRAMSLLSPEEPMESESYQLESLLIESSFLETRLREIMCLPCFGQAVEELPGLTEGRCRSLLPTWALAQCSPIAENSQVQWWDTLALRLIYGIG